MLYGHYIDDDDYECNKASRLKIDNEIHFRHCNYDKLEKENIKLKSTIRQAIDEIETYITITGETNLNLKYALDDLAEVLK